MHLRIVALTVSAMLFVMLAQGCSVGMAISGQEAPDLSVVRIGASRGEVERELGRAAAEINSDDGITYATYAYATGNAPSVGRAVAHGAMDVLTLGLWEVVGTPIEAVAGDEKQHAVVVGYDEANIVVAINYAIRRRDEDGGVDSGD